MNRQRQLHSFANSVGIFGVCVILCFAFFDQLLDHDLPCPLCLLQRISFVAIGLCMLMNLRLGIKPSHYGLMILASLLGLSVAIRQIFIHLKPGDLGYGVQFFGFHLYTWSAIAFTLILIMIGIGSLFNNGFDANYRTTNRWVLILIGLFLALILANGISTILECGLSACPADPTQYYL